MTTLKQLRDGISKAWDSVTDGWREVVDRTGDALTRFHPMRSGHDVETVEERVAHGGPRWGIVPVEVKLHDEDVEIALEVAGMDPGDFDIQVVDDVLVVCGEKKVERSRREGRYHVMERAYGAFERAVRLPVSVDDASARASYERGVLRITVPRAASHRTRRIEVKRG